jgi:hypothetical protein
MGDVFRRTWTDWGDSLASRFGTWATGDDGNRFRVLPVEEASHFTKEFTNIAGQLLPKAIKASECAFWETCPSLSYSQLDRTRIASVQTLSAVDLARTEEWAGNDGRTYRILSQGASDSWFGRMNDFALWANEMESFVRNTPETILSQLAGLLEGAGNFARESIKGAAGAAGESVAALVFPLLIPTALILGGVVVTFVVLQRSGALGTVAGAVSG